MVTTIDEKGPAGACRAVRTVVPTPIGVTIEPTTEAILGSEEVTLQAPGEFDDGSFRLNEPTLSRETVISAKGPTVGLVAVMRSVVVTVAGLYEVVADCVALIVMEPPSCNVTIFFERVAVA